MTDEDEVDSSPRPDGVASSSLRSSLELLAVAWSILPLQVAVQQQNIKEKETLKAKTQI